MSPRCFGSGSLSVHRPVDRVCTVYTYIRILAWCGVGPRVLCDIVGRTNAARPGFNGLMVCLPVVGFAFGLCDKTSTPPFRQLWLLAFRLIESNELCGSPQDVSPTSIGEH